MIVPSSLKLNELVSLYAPVSLVPHARLQGPIQVSFCKSEIVLSIENTFLEGSWGSSVS